MKRGVLLKTPCSRIPDYTDALPVRMTRAVMQRVNGFASGI